MECRIYSERDSGSVKGRKMGINGYIFSEVTKGNCIHDNLPIENLKKPTINILVITFFKLSR